MIMICAVLANMLMKSGINPFDSQEAKPYKNDNEIVAMTSLVNAYQNNDINDFEKILKQNRQTIMEDTFIREHIEDLLRNIRTQVLIKLIKPYTRIQIQFISGELNIETADVESLLVSCILDSTISGRIDQVGTEGHADLNECSNMFRCRVCWSWTPGARAPPATPPSTSGIPN